MRGVAGEEEEQLTGRAVFRAADMDNTGSLALEAATVLLAQLRKGGAGPSPRFGWAGLRGSLQQKMTEEQFLSMFYAEQWRLFCHLRGDNKKGIPEMELLLWLKDSQRETSATVAQNLNLVCSVFCPSVDSV